MRCAQLEVLTKPQLEPVQHQIESAPCLLLQAESSMAAVAKPAHIRPMQHSPLFVLPVQLINQLDAELGIEKFRTELESSRVLVSHGTGGHLEAHVLLALHASSCKPFEEQSSHQQSYKALGTRLSYIISHMRAMPWCLL
jgi:hypothetical protein